MHWTSLTFATGPYGSAAVPPNASGWFAPPVKFDFDPGLAGPRDEILSSDPYLDLPAMQSCMQSVLRQLAECSTVDLVDTG